jgi:hypothetical protein
MTGDDSRDRSLVRRLLVTSPTKIPVYIRERFEAIQRVGRQQACKSFRTNAPAPINQHLLASAETREEVSCRLPRANDLRRRSRVHGPDVQELILGQQRTNREVFDPRPRRDVGRLGSKHDRAASMHGHICLDIFIQGIRDVWRPESKTQFRLRHGWFSGKTLTRSWCPRQDLKDCRRTAGHCRSAMPFPPVPFWCLSQWRI